TTVGAARPHRPILGDEEAAHRPHPPRAGHARTVLRRLRTRRRGPHPLPHQRVRVRLRCTAGRTVRRTVTGPRPPVLRRRHTGRNPRRSAPARPHRLTPPGPRMIDPDTSPALRRAQADLDSVLALTQDLVRIPTRGGNDTYEAAITHLRSWRNECGHSQNVLRDETGSAVALTGSCHGRNPGPTWALDGSLAHETLGNQADE